MAIDPAPIKGVLVLPPSSLKVASVALRRPANRNLAVALTREQFRYGFGNALPVQESDELYERYAIPSPGKTLFEGTMRDGQFKDFTDPLRLKVVVGSALFVNLNCGGKDSGPAGARGAVMRFECTQAGLKSL